MLLGPVYTWKCKISQKLRENTSLRYCILYVGDIVCKCIQSKSKMANWVNDEISPHLPRNKPYSLCHIKTSLSHSDIGCHLVRFLPSSTFFSFWVTRPCLIFLSQSPSTRSLLQKTTGDKVWTKRTDGVEEAHRLYISRETERAGAAAPLIDQLHEFTHTSSCIIPVPVAWCQGVFNAEVAEYKRTEWFHC